MTSAQRQPLTGLRIVVIGIYFAPDSTGIAPYTTELCAQLSNAGAFVHAITGIPHYPEWSVPRQYRLTLLSHEQLGPVAVTRARHYVPRRQNVLKRGLYEATFAMSSYLATLGMDADVVLAVTPNIGALPVAGALARRRKVPFGVIVQDLVGQAASQSGIEGNAEVASLAGRLESRWLRSAHAVGVISPDFVRPLIAAGLDESLIVQMPNYTHVNPSSSEKPAARRALGWPVEGFYIVHTGNMGLKQDLENVVRAARCADGAGDQLRFVLLGDGSQRLALQARAAGIQSLRFCPPVDGLEYPLALAASDVLLVNERATVKDMSLPSKLTSYFSAGRPVVAATRADGATAREVARAGAGLVVEPGQPTALLAAIHRLMGDERLRQTLSIAGITYSSTWLSRAAAERRAVNFVASLAGRAALTSPL